MNILGHGVDIVDLKKIQSLIDDLEGDFVTKCFTEVERAYAGNGPKRIERFAGRFAAKEAVLKALGVGWSAGIAWTDVEIMNLPSGAPTIVLNGRAKQLSEEVGVVRWLVSTSHSDQSAVASAIALGKG